MKIIQKQLTDFEKEKEFLESKKSRALEDTELNVQVALAVVEWDVETLRRVTWIHCAPVCCSGSHSR